MLLGLMEGGGVGGSVFVILEAMEGFIFKMALQFNLMASTGEGVF